MSKLLQLSLDSVEEVCLQFVFARKQRECMSAYLMLYQNAEIFKNSKKKSPVKGEEFLGISFKLLGSNFRRPQTPFGHYVFTI